MRNSVVPRMSLIGDATLRANSPARTNVSSDAGLPASQSPASAANLGVGAIADTAIRAFRMVAPDLSSCTQEAAPATAMSISFRGMKRSYAEPLDATGGGNTRVESNSPFRRTFWPGPMQKSSATTSRLPFGPAMMHLTPKAINGAMESPAGEELHKLPPMLARL